MPRGNSGMVVQKAQFSVVRGIHAIEVLHELQDISLVMAIGR